MQGTIDAEALAAKLRRRIKGEVRFDNGSRALYATDGSNYRQPPIGVVLPRDAEDVEQTVALCHELGAPIISRGGGTSLAGQCCNVAVLMDFSKYMRRIIEVNPQRKIARVEPGVVCDELRNAAEKYHLTFGPDPATHAWCTFGGMIGNNSCGVHSQMAGRTSDNLEALEILTYDGTRMRVGATDDRELQRLIGEGGRSGEVYGQLKKLRDRYAPLIRARFPKLPRRISGYNLEALLPEQGFHVARALAGSESTCVVILEATVRLMHSPLARSLLVLGYPDVFHAADHVVEIGEYGAIGLEAIDRRFVADLRKKHLQVDNLVLFPEGGGYLLVEFGGETREESDAAAHKLMRALRKRADAPTMKLFDHREQERRIWEVRESALGATAHVPGMKENWEGWEDSAVAPERLGRYLRDLQKLYDKYGYFGCLYGHFGQGCVHTRIDFDLKTTAGMKRFRAFVEEAADLVVKHGGSFSGEHGDGQSRAELLPKMFGPELVQAFNEFKAIWDPQWKMNPGKVVKPYRLDENLRYGPNYRPDEPATHFKFPGDNFSFASAMERCVGVGKCRREDAGTMCPSYMVTREEMHSTRGRARLLFEMLRGDMLQSGWRSEAVKEALDLCLSCKGCKVDCPVNVDMATYKAEFLSHYYKRRLRPRHAYAFGLIHRWATLASHFRRLANFMGQTVPFSTMLKWVAGIAAEREVPRFAEEPFREWWSKMRKRADDSSTLSHTLSGTLSKGSPQSDKVDKVFDKVGRGTTPLVLLWPDTFTNYFHPHIARAAVEVLEDAGFEVAVPRHNMCCGRPLYDYGMLDTAEKWLRNILDNLRPEIEAGIPMVVLEPSCCAVFREELTNLLPNNQDAQRLRRQTFTLSEFLVKQAHDYPRRELKRRAIVHGHCHQKAIMGMECEEEILNRLGLDFEMLDAGCCGMAGAFGFEKEHYEISVKCGERVLLPRVRQTESETLIITNGFSCHEQIVQRSDRRPLHLAELLHLAMREGTPRPLQPYKEDAAPAEAIPEDERAPKETSHHRARWGVMGATLVAAGAAGAWMWRHRSNHDGYIGQADS